MVTIRNAAATDDAGLLNPLLKRWQDQACSQMVFGLPAVQSVINFKWDRWALLPACSQSFLQLCNQLSTSSGSGVLCFQHAISYQHQVGQVCVGSTQSVINIKWDRCAVLPACNQSSTSSGTGVLSFHRAVSHQLLLGQVCFAFSVLTRLEGVDLRRTYLTPLG